MKSIRGENGDGVTYLTLANRYKNLYDLIDEQKELAVEFHENEQGEDGFSSGSATKLAIQICNQSYVSPNKSIEFIIWFVKKNSPKWIAADFEGRNPPVDDRKRKIMFISKTIAVGYNN